MHVVCWRSQPANRTSLAWKFTKLAYLCLTDVNMMLCLQLSSCKPCMLLLVERAAWTIVWVNTAGLLPGQWKRLQSFSSNSVQEGCTQSLTLRKEKLTHWSPCRRLKRAKCVYQELQGRPPHLMDHHCEVGTEALPSTPIVHVPMWRGCFNKYNKDNDKNNAFSKLISTLIQSSVPAVVIFLNEIQFNDICTTCTTT